eukprot:861298-Prymnesium_polylepis.1
MAAQTSPKSDPMPSSLPPSPMPTLCRPGAPSSRLRWPSSVGPIGSPRIVLHTPSDDSPARSMHSRLDADARSASSRASSAAVQRSAVGNDTTSTC